MSKFHDVNDLISEKAVSVKEKNGLKVIKYTKGTFFKQDFSDERMLDCRGTVIDAENNIASLPFKKLFNCGEEFAPIIPNETPIIAVEKLNGFMLAASVHNGKFLYNTTGSLENIYIEWGKEYIQHFTKTIEGEIGNPYTYLFEICHPNDPHIVKEEYGAYLIGIRHKTLGNMVKEETLDEAGKNHFLKRPKWFKTTFAEIKTKNESCEKEGYILREDTDKQKPLCKLKSPTYRFRKVLARSKDAHCFSKAEVFTKENGKLEKQFEFVKNNKNAFFQLEEQERLKALDEMKIPEINYIGTLFLLRGLPGSGKSALASHLGFDYYEADMFFTLNGEYCYDREKIGEAHSWCKKQVQEAMERKEQEIIVSNTFTTEKEMQPYHNLALKYKYKVFSLIVENRHQGINAHNVPQETLEKMKNRFIIKL